MFKNVAGQKYRVFAFNRSSSTPVEGDAANITAKISKDYGTAVTITDTNPTETEDGYYLFDLSQEETNCDNLAIYPESSTDDVQVIGIPPSSNTRLDDDRGFLVNFAIKYADNSYRPVLRSDHHSEQYQQRDGRVSQGASGRTWQDRHAPAGRAYYMWRRKPGSTFTDPASVTVASNGSVGSHD